THRVILFLLIDAISASSRPPPLHDALPISIDERGAGQHRIDHQYATGQQADACLGEAADQVLGEHAQAFLDAFVPCQAAAEDAEDRKSTRLNSSHVNRSYAVLCLKKESLAV